MRYFLIIGLIITLSSCKTTNLFMEPKRDRSTDVADLDSEFHYNPDYQYHIRKDDKISISVWGEEELSVGSVYSIYNSNEVYGKWLQVDAQGNIESPMLGSIRALDMTVIELKDTIKNRLDKYLVKPVIDVKVLNREVTLLGEVGEPRVVTLDKENNTLVEVLAMGGGYEFYAEMRYVKVIRQKGEDVLVANVDLTKSGDYLSQNLQLHPGDVVVVTSKRYKTFDKRVSIILPFATVITAVAILIGLL